MNVNKKPKKVNYRVLARSGEPELYELMDSLIAEHHGDLGHANIAIAWRFGWKPDADGRLTLGQMKKASDVDRQLHGHDFALLLNYEAWTAAEFTQSQKLALLDHELCHAAISYDEDGEPRRDEQDNLVYRVRKHTIEEFTEVVRRHGLWRHDLQAFAEASVQAKKHPLLHNESIRQAVEDLRPKKGSGIDSITFEVPGEDPVTLEAG